MIQLDEVPPFKGDESPEEAERWLKTLIIATGSFSNSGILRFLHTRLKENSPAMDWYDGLDEDSKTSWIRFQPPFRQRWIQSSAHHDEWHAFCNHILTCADLFQGGRDSDLATLSDRVTIWANDHLELGKAVNRTDSALIEASRRLAPDFVDAYLQVYTQTSSTTTFYDYCDAIKSIPQTVLQMEHIRFRQSSNNWQTAMEKKINDVSSKIDQLLSLRDETASINAKLSDHLMGKPAPAMQGSSSTGVAWEACSPFTSMMSLEDNSAQDAIGATTPVAPQASLESTQDRTLALLSRITAIQGGYGEDQTDDKSTSSLLSQKPTAVTTKSGLIHTACQSMTFISSLHALFGEKNIAFTTSAIAIYDRVTGTRSKICNDPCPTSDCTSDEGLWNGIRSMYKYHLLESQETMLEAKTEWNKYVSPLEPKYYMIGPNMKELDFNSNRIILSLQTASGVAELAGGILAGNVNEQHPVLSSSRTVLFLLLSCYLAEASGEAQHRRIAKLSANCVATQMIDSQTSLVSDYWINTATMEKLGVASCSLTGMVIEAFSVLACATRDDTWGNKAIEIATAAMKHTEWHGPDGTLLADQAGHSDMKYTGLLHRGLLIAYERNPEKHAFRDQVRSYINVQFNALYQLSGYRVMRRGEEQRRLVGLQPDAQMAALDTLVAAIGVNL